MKVKKRSFLKVVSISAVLLLFTQLFTGMKARAADTDTWDTVGTAEFSEAATSVKMAVDSHGTCYVAYDDTANGSKITVKKFNGVSWEPVGSPDFSTGQVDNLNICIDSKDVVYVAYRDDCYIRVKKFSSGAWQDAASDKIYTDSVDYACLAIDKNDVPYVLYDVYNEQGDSGYPACVKKYNGTSWNLVGKEGEISPSQIDNVCMAINPVSNQPYVAAMDSNSKKSIAKMFDGTSWKSLGTMGFTNCPNFCNSLAFDSRGTPYLAYEDGNSSAWNSYVKKWSGSTWESVGSDALSNHQGDPVNILFDSNDNLYLSYRNSDFNVTNAFMRALAKKYDGTSWKIVGTAGFSGGQISYISSAIDKNGNLYEAYVDRSSNKITVKKFNLPPAPAATEITSFDKINDISAGNAGSATYSDAAKVIAALPTTVKANNGAVTVPVSTWVDTDHYNPNAAGSYTFTATLGTMPAGYKNTGNYTATVEVIVSPAPVPAPALTADTISSDIHNPIDITFTDDAAWRTAITEIDADSVKIDKSKYTISDGKIEFNAGVLGYGTHSIQIKANGYTTASVTQTVKGDQVAAPTASPAGGAVAEGTTVSLSTATDGAAIFYTINGRTPTTSDTYYNGPITINASTTIKAIAVKDGMENSSVMSDSYTIGTAPAEVQVSVTKSNPTAGENDQIVLTAKDSHGNIDTQFNDLKNVTVSGYRAAPDGSYGRFSQCPIASLGMPVIGCGVGLGSILSSINPVGSLAADSTTLGFYFEQGVAYANLALNNAAAQDIVFTVEGVDTPTTAPSAITPVPAAATSMSLTQDITAPSSNGRQFAKQPQVTLKDQYLNICTNDNSTQVTASKNDTGTWMLTGTAAVAAKAGIVSFTDLGASNAEAVTGAQLAFNAANCTQITSGLVNLPAPGQTPGSTVTVAEGSVSGATAGDSKVTGLTKGNKYKVTVDGAVKYVKADGTLSDNESDAAALTGTEIIGLTNGKTYKVEACTPPSGNSFSVQVTGKPVETVNNLDVTPNMTGGYKFKLSNGTRDALLSDVNSVNTDKVDVTISKGSKSISGEFPKTNITNENLIAGVVLPVTVSSPIIVAGNTITSGNYNVSIKMIPGSTESDFDLAFTPIPDSHSGGSSSSSSGSTSAQTTVTGSVVDGKTGTQVSGISAKVTTDSNGNSAVSMKASEVAALKAPDGTVSGLTDVSKLSITTDKGTPVTIGTDGTVKIESLAKGTTNNFNLTYDLGNGQKIVIGTMEVKVGTDGKVGLQSKLIDPYGIITDASTGKPIDGANVTVYYANTDRNKAAGKKADTVVPLPGIDGFKPNNNKNPQVSDSSGAYGFMVFPNSDYYVVVTKDGYYKYVSPTISVEQEIVKWDIRMNKEDVSSKVTGVQRLSGQNRIDTALDIAKATYPGKISNVVIASAQNYPDALSGSVLAYKLNAPMLLVGSTDENQQKVLAYIKTCMDNTGSVYILGGNGAVSKEFEDKVTANGFKNITRLGGADRYETSEKIAEKLNVNKETPVVIVSGENYADAVSISSTAAVNQYPILLARKNEIPDTIKKEVSTINPTKVFIIGLQGSIGQEVENTIAQIIPIEKSNITRIGGSDRYETSLEIGKYFKLDGNEACIASGNNFPDALAGSIYAGKHNAPIVLVNTGLSDNGKLYLKDRKLSGATIFGGEGVVDKNVQQQIYQVIGK
ncbi:N-acetylmuramoyl-L-alanine amidase LytC precursor [Clostridium ragsdalei P11]|uniref:N-acetylmuramoyl-L-alanine amidase LytC n=1 Tax=Clostridium ragsdalei P11 TaxID=1353534 RepID=A0A1A6AT94_9CLOT|nr:cell wall-binding repeat-containing protein [Clostridium ragsdalei]OBR93301.1 N-acetylmuramoyl-L-alanine amidase LytC precursor [Clostridium ragsdalei P11]